MHSHLKAQMAESVDALVSNTSGATRAGSTPALGTKIGLEPFGYEPIFIFSQSSEYFGGQECGCAAIE